MCKKHGAAVPMFEERQEFLIVTFKTPMVPVGVAAASEVQTRPSRGQGTGQVVEQVLRFCQTPRKASEIRELLNLRHRETFTDNYLRPLLKNKLVGTHHPRQTQKPPAKVSPNPGRGKDAERTWRGRWEMTKVQHYWLEVDALSACDAQAGMTKPMVLKEEVSPYRR